MERSDTEARPRFDWHRWLPAIVAAGVVLGAVVGATVTVLVIGAKERPGSLDTSQPADVLASMTAATTTTVPTTTTTQATTTTTEPPPTTTEPPPPPQPTMESEPPGFDDSGEWRTEPPPTTCVTGTMKVTDISFTPDPEYDDSYEVTGFLVNGTDVSWEFYGTVVAFGTSEFPDRQVESAWVHTDVNEIRPGERLPLHGSVSSWTRKPLVAAWWDRQGDFVGGPMVDEPWAFC